MALDTTKTIKFVSYPSSSSNKELGTRIDVSKESYEHLQQVKKDEGTFKITSSLLVDLDDEGEIRPIDARIIVKKYSIGGKTATEMFASHPFDLAQFLYQ